MIRRFEEISNNAWPALQTMQYDGWVLRFANGVTKRSNSVNLLYPSKLDPDEKISFCEKMYVAQGITPCFKITAISDPTDLDQLLASKDYFIHSHVSFQVMNISGLPTGTDFQVEMAYELNAGWIDDFIRMNEFEINRRTTYISIMEQIHLPKCLVSIRRGRQTIGVGLGVVEDHYIGLFDIVVDKSSRNSGLGKLIVENIFRWGRNMGAGTAYLQVLTQNLPAIGLYEKIGFKEQYRYWYRMKK